MGRKSAKGKEKKAERKKMSAIIAEKQAVIDKADALEDPLSVLAPPFKKFDRNGLSVTLGAHRCRDMDEETLEFAFQLTKDNMQTLYEQSDWGWSDKTKKEEMSEDKARYLIARKADGTPVAAVHFRFDLDCDDIVLYCYEIQLKKEARRKGLGKFMMQILELLALKTEMTKVMLTVLTHNADANEFFKKKLKYEVDETSPEESICEAFYDEEGYTYQILSKPIGAAARQKKPLTPKTTNCQQAARKGCCGSC